MSGYLVTDKSKITTCKFLQMKNSGDKISMLTAYDYTTASIIDEAGIDGILVGDSASNVMQGNMFTLPISVEEIIYHARSVVKAVKRALVICDMPFGSYQTSAEDGVRNAIKIMKESGADAVKIEGGSEYKDTISAIINAGIPVMGHLGLTPQSVHKFGGYGLRAKDEGEARKLLDDSKLLDEIGCFGITLEKVPSALAKKVTQNVSCATIGIGAGSYTDGQILVYADMLGMTHHFKPKFLRQYADLHNIMSTAIGNYISDIKSSTFPSQEESY